MANLLKNPYTVGIIPCQEWLHFFETLDEKLDSIHKTLDRLHNDVKPENIGLTLQDTIDSIRFAQIDFYDFSATLTALIERGGFGDLRYQEIKRSLAGVFFKNVKNANVDNYALGLTFSRKH